LPLDQDEGRGYLVFWGGWEKGDDACVAFDTRPKSASIKKKSIQNIWNSKRLKEEEPNAALKKCVLPRAVKLIYKRNIRTGFRARGVQRIGSGSSSSPGVENWNLESGHPDGNHNGDGCGIINASITPILPMLNVIPSPALALYCIWPPRRATLGKMRVQHSVVRWDSCHKAQWFRMSPNFKQTFI